MFLPPNSVPLARSLACKQMVHIPRCQILHEKARAGLPSQPVSSPFLNRPTVLSLVESFSWFNTVLPFKSSKVDSHLMNHALHNCDLFFIAKSDMPTLSVYYFLQVLPICDYQNHNKCNCSIGPQADTCKQVRIKLNVCFQI